MTEGLKNREEAGKFGFLRVLRLVALFCALLLALVLADAGSGEKVRSLPTEGAIEVLVIDEGGRALEGVSLVFHEALGARYRVAANALTDPKGRATLPVAKNGIVLAKKEGYVRRGAAAERGGRIELRLERGRSLRIDVRGSGEEGSFPLEGATVLVHDSSRASPVPWARATDRAGRALFESVPSGEVKVVIYARGFAPYEALTSGDLLVELSPVRGVVVHVRRNGVGVSGALVRISGASLWPERTIETNENGSVRISGLAPGSYALFAEKGDAISAPIPGFVVAAGTGDDEITLDLLPGKQAFVEVADDEGAPLGDARVLFSADGFGQMSRNAVTDVHGRAKLAPLFETVGVVLVSKLGYVERIVPIDGEGPHRIVLDRTATVSGEVVDERGFPVRDVLLSAVGTDRSGMPIALGAGADRLAAAHFDWSNDTARRLVPSGELGVLIGPVPPIPLSPTPGVSVEPLFEEATSDEKGRFVLDGVPPGRVVVLARHNDFLDARSETQNLAPGGHAHVKIVLRNGEPLRFRVLDERDFPVADARVLVTGKGIERTLSGSSDGAYSLAVAPGEIVFRVSRADEPLRVLLEERVATRKPGDEIVLRLPPPRGDTLFSIEDERGEPVTMASVRLSSKDEKVPLRETRFSSERGEAEFRGVFGLPVELVVSAPGFVKARIERTIGEKEKLVLERALELRGKITVARGRQPAPDSNVTLQGPGFSRKLSSDALGEYSIKDAPPGSFTLTAEHPEFGRAKKKLVVTRPKNDSAVELPPLDLVSAVKVRVRVTDERGFPLARALVSSESISPFRDGSSFAVETTDPEGIVELEIAEDTRELCGALLGRAFGCHLVREAREGAELALVLAEEDEAPPDASATVLIGLGEKEGRIFVGAVEAGSEEAEELRIGDEIVSVDGRRPTSVLEARELLSGPPSSRVRIDLFRGRREVAATLDRKGFQKR